MPNKIKLFFSFLALIALFSIYNVFNSFSQKTADIVTTNTSSTLSFTIDEDLDRDGLTNKEESYWNTDFQNPDTDGDKFLDGEEVTSGHDPLKPGPNDLLSTSGNITAKVADLIVGGIYSQDLKPGVNNQKYNKAINDLSLSVLDDFYSTQSSAKVSLNLIDPSTENQVQYLKNISGVIKADLLDFPEKLDIDKGLNEQSNFFLNKSRKYSTSHETLALMPVPKNWASVHKTALDILERLSINYTFMGSYALDPLKSVLAMNEVQKNIQPEIKSLLQDVQLQIREDRLNLNDNFYQILNLLYP